MYKSGIHMKVLQDRIKLFASILTVFLSIFLTSQIKYLTRAFLISFAIFMFISK